MLVILAPLSLGRVFRAQCAISSIHWTASELPATSFGRDRAELRYVKGVMRVILAMLSSFVGGRNSAN